MAVHRTQQPLVTGLKKIVSEPTTRPGGDGRSRGAVQLAHRIKVWGSVLPR